ncbi:sensor histidine kinase [Bacillus sp. A301a_S52]|nr:sensor histidine kinase [Bacillus sp. A301a_S52]
MFLQYVLHKKSWIAIIIVLLFLMNGIILFDYGITVNIFSLTYLNVLFLLTFMVFFIWRYKKETSYIHKLQTITEELQDNWRESLPQPSSLFPDEAIDELLWKVDDFYRKNISELKKALVIENDYVTSWIHEIKAPLTAMKVTLDAHRKNDFMQKIESNWLRLHLLIDRQLYITRLSMLESDYTMELIQLDHLLSEEVRDLAAWCMEKNIAVDIQNEEERKVFTDRKWCRFIIRQVLTNAIKYSPHGGTIVMGIDKAEKGNIILRIQDEGPGIQAHDLPRVFDKGFTGENGRIQNSATGLGLYLAREAANKLHITFDITSTFGQGTSVYMVFSVKDKNESIRRNALR